MNLRPPGYEFEEFFRTVCTICTVCSIRTEFANDSQKSAKIADFPKPEEKIF